MRNIAMLMPATLIFLSILPVTASAQGKEHTFTVDGKPLKFAYGKPFTDLNGRLQVPIQQIEIIIYKDIPDKYKSLLP